MENAAHRSATAWASSGWLFPRRNNDEQNESGALSRSETMVKHTCKNPDRIVVIHGQVDCSNNKKEDI